MFGLLAKGVRTENTRSIPAKGMPKDLGWRTSDNYWIHVNNEYSEEEGYCSVEMAQKWESYGSHYDRDAQRVSDPDWHSHSWLTTKELEQQLDIYNNEASDYNEPEYMAILASMKEIEKYDYECRVVFWFDN